MSPAAASPSRFSLDNSLVDVDASLPLAVIARQCRERGFLFPLARPLPALSLAEACARLPFFVDAYVASVDAVTAAGLPLSTGSAPRAATGPDLVGALCARPPLAVAVRARVRVLDASCARRSAERFEEAPLAAARLGSLLDEGRAFAALATKGDGGYWVRAVGGPASLPSADPGAEAAFADGGVARITSSRSLVPGDAAALAGVLERGVPVAAAPLMGRAAALLSHPGAPSISSSALGEGGAVAFARALVRAGARHG